MTTAISRLSRLLLSDGRHIAWREYGREGGTPVVFTHGNLNSSSFLPLWAQTSEKTAEVGARVISLDRPGYGESTFLPGRAYPSMADDVRQLMDHLKLDRIAVVGFSSGGPNALAIAAGLGARVTCCGLFSSDGPYKAMGIGKEVFGTDCLTYEASVERAIESEKAMRESYAKAKPERVPLLMADIDGAVAQGIDKGPAQDAVLESGDWGFDLAGIVCPVLAYHGTDDTDVPVACARYLGEAVPARVTVFEGENHSLIRRKWIDMLSAVVSESGGCSL